MEEILLNPDDPDFFIEDFWYNLKASMKNFYNTISIYENKKEIIKEWSLILNEHKKNKEYNLIEQRIREYITIYSIDLLELSLTSYHDEILLTNIKRWEKISNEFNFNSNIEYCKKLLIFMIFVELKKNNIFIFDYKTLYNDDYNDLILFALKNSKTKILDLLNKIPYFNLIDNIKILCPSLKFDDKITMVKLCNLYKKNIN
jgi:hypothetical protein